VVDLCKDVHGRLFVGRFGRCAADPTSGSGCPGSTSASWSQGQGGREGKVGFKKLVQAYSYPAVYQHRDFNERAYGEYREGKGLFTPQ
jgi:hypothetical protein